MVRELSFGVNFLEQYSGTIREITPKKVRIEITYDDADACGILNLDRKLFGERKITCGQGLYFRRTQLTLNGGAIRESEYQIYLLGMPQVVFTDEEVRRMCGK